MLLALVLCIPSFATAQDQSLALLHPEVSAAAHKAGEIGKRVPQDLDAIMAADDNLYKTIAEKDNDVTFLKAYLGSNEARIKLAEDLTELVEANMAVILVYRAELQHTTSAYFESFMKDAEGARLFVKMASIAGQGDKGLLDLAKKRFDQIKKK
jgi:hypothetical protein